MVEIQAIHECLFCPQTFDTATAKDDHVLEHFAQETCMECDRNLIRIGGNLYVKHDVSTCVQRTLKRKYHGRPPSVNSLITSNNQTHADGFEPNDEFPFTCDVSIKIEEQDSFNEHLIDFMEFSNDPHDLAQSSCGPIVESQNQLLSCKTEPELQLETEEMESNDGQSFIQETADADAKNTMKIACEICGQKVNKSSLPRHKVLKHSSPDTTKKFCNLCGRLFSALEDRDAHRAECAFEKKMRMEKKSHPDLRCDLCSKNKSFKSDSIYRQHMKRIHNQRVTKFKCERCHTTFLKESWLEEHQCTGQPMIDINNKSPFVCEICQQSFVYKQSLQRHQLRAHATENSTVSNNSDEHLPQKAEAFAEIQCDLCTTNFQSNANLRIHMRRKHDFSIDQFKCPQCSAVLLNESSRQSHNCSDDQALACDICKRVFNAKSALRRHMRVEHDPDGCKFKCKSCGTIFAQESSLQGHKCVPRARNLSTKYECNICSKVYQFKFNLRRHIRATHDPDIDKFKCRICGCVFMQELSLKKHKCKRQREVISERKAKGTGEIQCDICTQKFHSNAYLRKHKRIKHDSSIEKFRCTICRAIFLKESSLQSHICPRRHAYPCDICNKQLSRSHLLRIHKVLFHSAPGTIYCNVCGKLFTVADERDEHQLQCKLKKKIKSLQFVGRFECVCKKVYKTKHDLRRHMRGKHSPDVDKFKCRTCGCVFVQEASLQKHECKGRQDQLSQRELIPCESCGKIVTRGGLRQHRVAFHSAPGTLFCSSCYKVFANNDDLDAHRQKCALKKGPRPCEICGKILANPGALARHKLSLHSAGTVIFCKTCVKKFKTVEELNAHMPECMLKRKLQKFQKQEQLPEDDIE